VDLGSTNGVSVNGKRVLDHVSLAPLDHIMIGDTLLVYDQTAPQPQSPAESAAAQPRKRALLSPMNGNAEHVLASDNLIGHGITCDLILEDPRSATRQAKIILHEGGTYTIEDLAGNGSTLINDRPVHAGERIQLTNGDRVQFGSATYQYLEVNS